mgnify:CR=1 FL=1
MEKKTPLYEKHVALGGKMVPFAGYLLPVQYPAGVIAEHRAVRERAGIFDVSHMGEVLLEGPDAVRNLEHLLTNRFADLKLGSCRYALMLYDNGGTVGPRSLSWTSPPPSLPSRRQPSSSTCSAA